MSKRCALLGVLLSGLAMACVLTSCGNGGDVVQSDDQSSIQSPHAVNLKRVKPEVINQPVAYGDELAAPNSRWFFDEASPPVLITRNSDWFGLPDLPEKVASVGVVAAGGSLYVTAIRCDQTVDCSTSHQDRGESVEGNLIVWEYTGKGGYAEVALPDDLLLPADALTGGSSAEYAALRTSGGVVVFSFDGARLLEEVSIETGGAFGFEVVGDRLAVVASDDGANFSSIESVSIKRASEASTSVRIPNRVAGSWPYFFGNQALWIQGGYEIVLDIVSGKLTQTPLPEAVEAIAGLGTALGSVVVAGATSELFVFPSALLPADGQRALAIRRSDGAWDSQPFEPVLPESVVDGTRLPTVVEADGTVRRVGG